MSQEHQPVVVVERSGGGTGSFLLGIVLGAGLALLLAPQSGEETRSVLRSKGKRLRTTAEEKVDDLQEQFEDGYERVKARVEEGFEVARRTVEDKRVGAREALDAGKSAVHSARDELERRLADARSARAKVTDEEAPV
jgi:gas vesicle protein